MDPERWRRIEAVFQEAVELPEADRGAFLDKTCGGDGELRLEVDNLLESDRQSQEGIGEVVHSASHSLADNLREELRADIGRRVGHYQIVREIGRGGMGAVYQAVRADDQFMQSVAIKFIAQGMDTPESLSRFRVERQILATLQHPSIAGLLDGGTTDGRPYIVMEYIEGEPLLEYCQQRKLAVPERLELFRALCGAVHHAHQMLVIHRDIKPGNVLVTSDGVPKLLDFGIAKLLAPELVPGVTSQSHTVMRMLTPEYASPEQIRGETLTTASDIYSLGVLLYELLTNTSPYRTTSRSSQELERLVCEGVPPRMSTAAAGDARLKRQLSGDLENIVSMAMRKEPARRYSSAQQFADDIHRYLQGLPVTARKDTLFYLAGKMVRRNKLATAAFALLMVSVAVGITATIRESRRTQRRFEEVRKLANSVLFDFPRVIQHLPGSIPARELVVRTGLEYLNNLSNDAGDDQSLQWEISQAYEQIGDVLGDPSGPNLGKFSEALTSYRKARSMVEPIAGRKKDSESLSCLIWLHYKIGDLEARTAGIDPAANSYGRGLEAARRLDTELKDPHADELLRNGYQRMSMAKLRAGDYTGALENARSAAAAADRAARNKPGAGAAANVARSRLLLGNVLWLKGDLLESWSHHESAIKTLEELRSKRPDDDAYLVDLQEAYRRSGDLQGNPSYFHFDNLERAREYQGKALAITEQLVERDPKNAQAQAELSAALRRLAAVTRLADPPRAQALYTRAIAIIEQLRKSAPNDLTYPRELANARLGMSIALSAGGNWTAAVDEVSTAISMQQAMIDKNPLRSVIREDMFDALVALGDVRLKMGELPGALEAFNRALVTARFLVERSIGSLYAERCLALVSQKLGDYHARMEQRQAGSQKRLHAAESRRWYEAALAIWSRWRSQGLAVPYSTNREKEVQQILRAGR